MQTKKIRIQQLEHGKNLPLPTYATTGSAGMDLLSANETPIVVNPHEVVLVPTGIIIEIETGYEGQIRPRSGLAVKHGITVLNSPGTIDSDYRGEVKVILINHSEKPFTINRGERIAQLIISSFEKIEWDNTESLSQTARNDGGFGHTGR
ncbi:MAG: dUTP diphosphatase [Ignavibacteria bacterium]|nr:dUTP diphosphatase [Ignavibacteria bacterium]